MLDELGDWADRPDALVGLGRAVQRQGDFERSVALAEENLAIARETGDHQFIAQALCCVPGERSVDDQTFLDFSS